MVKISGKIVDVNNEPLMGANITLRSGAKSGKVGTVSDFEGNFSLESDSFVDSDLFEVSYVGFIKQQFKASELQNKKIVLKESISEFPEVVVIGTKPKKSNDNNKNKLKSNLAKNKYLYAGAGGLLGLALILMSIKKMK